MPTLIPGGPDIPPAVFDALEDGRLVLFCGAGISVPALPDFRGLVKALYEALGEEATPEERIALKAGQLDRVLGLLEGRINEGELRREVNRILTLSPTADLSLHKAILTLSRTPEGVLRLLTTNFDNAFESAGCPEDEVDRAPRLPVPKPLAWQSLVHLHGRIHPGRPERDDLVLTSADFGTAYLAEGWASRFVTELFRHFTVLFVGYSVDDPVMRYLTDALASERRSRGINFRTPYAFAAIQGREENRKRIEVQWRSKSVEAVFYDARHHHLKLRKTLEAWADMHRFGLQSKRYIISKHAKDAPPEGRIDEVARRVVWAISEPSGVAAAEFAAAEPVPPLRWLQVFDHPEFESLNLLSSAVRGTKISVPLVENSFRSGWSLELSKPTARLVYWLCRHLKDRGLLEWVLKRGGVLHPEFRRAVRGHLGELDEKLEPLRSIWEILASDSFARATSIQYNRIDEQDLQSVPLSPLVRNEILCLLAPLPHMEPKKRLDWIGRPIATEISGETIQGLMSVELKLAGGDQAKYFLDYVLAEAANRDEVLFAIADDLTSLLIQSMQWLTLLGLADHNRDPSNDYIRSIASSIPARRLDSWARLIELARESFRVSAQRDQRLTEVIIGRWRGQDFPVFRRLLLYAATTIRTLAGPVGLDILLEDGAKTLWEFSTHHEVLRFLQQAGGSLNSQDFDRLMTVIKAGPPIEHYPDASQDEYSRECQIWERMSALRRSGAMLAQEDLDWISRVQQKWQLEDSAGSDEEYPISATIHYGRSSDYSSDQADAFEDEELIRILLRDRDKRGGLLDKWRQLIRRKPGRGARLLRQMAAQGEWPSRIWESFLFAFRDSKIARGRARTFVGYLLSTAPSSLFNEIPRAIAEWLCQASTQPILPECEATYRSIVDSLWPAAFRQPAMLQDPVDSAINHAAGILTEALLQRLGEPKPQMDDGIPSSLRSYFDAIISGETESYVLARVILATQLDFLYAADPEWARSNLIPRFDWVKSREASALWAGYLSHPRMDPELFEELKAGLLQGLEHLESLGGKSTNVVRLLAFASLEFPTSLSKQENLFFLRSLGVEQLAKVGKVLEDILRGAGNQAGTLWNERVGPWFDRFWPRGRDKKGPQVGHSLALAAIAAGQAFPEAVAAVKNYLQPGHEVSGVLFALEKSEQPDRHPEVALSLLDALLPYNESHRFWFLRKKIEMVVERIREAGSTTDDPRHRRIEEFLAKSEI